MQHKFIQMESLQHLDHFQIIHFLFSEVPPDSPAKISFGKSGKDHAVKFDDMIAKMFKDPSDNSISS